MRDEIDFASCMPTVARALLGEPNKALSSRDELRYGAHGSISIKLKTGTWFDHENDEGGGVLALIKREKGLEGRPALQYLCELGCIDSAGNPKPNGHDLNEAVADIPYDPDKDPFKGATFKRASKPQFQIVRTWLYVDEAGADLFEVCRLENGEIEPGGKAAKTYRQRHKGPDGAYVDNVKGIRQVPYRLPDLIKAVAKGETIFVAEGEKCCDALMAIGATATCNAMGANKWPDVLTPFFKNADIVILPDNDGPGAKHTALVAERLSGVARQVRILELPNLSPKSDVADWIEAGGTLAQLQDLTKRKPCEAQDSPLPLFPPMADAEPYPVEALGHTLSRAEGPSPARHRFLMPWRRSPF